MPNNLIFIESLLKQLHAYPSLYGIVRCYIHINLGPEYVKILEDNFYENKLIIDSKKLINIMRKRINNQNKIFIHG